MKWSVIQMSDGRTTLIARKGQYWAAAQFLGKSNNYERDHWTRWAESSLGNIAKRWPNQISITPKQLTTIAQLKPERTLGHLVMEIEGIEMVALRVIAKRNSHLREVLVAEHEGYIYLAVYPYLSDFRVCQKLAPPTSGELYE